MPRKHRPEYSFTSGSESIAESTRSLPNMTIVDIFDRQVAKTGDGIALVCGGERFSYAELDAASDRLAHVLVAQGVSAGQIVASVTTRSAWVVVALLATWKTGAVFLPLDPTHPSNRLGFIVAHAQPTLVITDIADLSIPEFGNRYLRLDPTRWSPNSSEVGGAMFVDRPRAMVDPRAPAYVVYTSGTSGRPKGVVVAHRSLINLYFEIKNTFFPQAARTAGGGPARVAHAHSLSFDASWNPLLWMFGGHELHLLSDEVRKDPAEFVAATRRAQLGVVEVTATWAEQLVAVGLLEPRRFPLLLLMGGEAVSTTLWTRLRADDGVQAANLYGPTECTVYVTSCLVNDYPSPTIGRPIANTYIRIVDSDDRLVPVGEAGELLVGGECLAIGYLRSPELTDAKFVADPVGPPGGRLYRTGDLVRCTPDGVLEFLGRKDEQVKIRGHRVEPGELENVLLRRQEVLSAAVTVDNSTGEPRLIAFFVAATGPDTSTVTEIREILQTELPEYLVPVTVIRLDAMPVGATGKIDRAALIQLSRMPSPKRTSFVGPRDEVEQQIVEIWSDLLGIDAVDISVDDDFFDIGGHSLMAARLATRIRAVGVSCSLRDVMRAPTVVGLAELFPPRVGTAPHTGHATNQSGGENT